MKIIQNASFFCHAHFFAASRQIVETKLGNLGEQKQEGSLFVLWRAENLMINMCLELNFSCSKFVKKQVLLYNTPGKIMCEKKWLFLDCFLKENKEVK